MTIKESSECERCKVWKKVLTKILGSITTEFLEDTVERELAHARDDSKGKRP